MAQLDISNRGLIYQGAAPGANTNILASNLTFRTAGAIRLTVVLATSSVFNVRMTDGTTATTRSLNQGAALVAGTFYTFVIGVAPRNSVNNGQMQYNFQVATNGTIAYLSIDEVRSAVV